jgi:chorismate mutase
MVINVYPGVKNADPILIKAALSLLNQRLRMALEIGKSRKKTGEKIYDPKREREVPERLRSRNKGLLKD